MNIKTTTEKVKEFHELFEHPIGSLNELEPLNVRQLRIKLLFEELSELADASDVNKTFYDLCCDHVTSQTLDESIEIIHNAYLGIFDGDNVNKVEELDAITDIQYVLDGKKLTSGLHEICDKAFDLVHKNNMNKAHITEDHCLETISKFKGDSFTYFKRGKYWIVQNEHGKLIKPHDHKKVDLTILF